MLSPGTYLLDRESIMLSAYRLLALFYANKEIARLSDPENRDDAASRLERRFFSREMTHLLLQVAIGVRVLDDQMMGLPPSSADRQQYLRRRDGVNARHSCMVFADLTLRETCNKIIHATVVEPHSTAGTESHKIDEYNWISWQEAKEHEPSEPWQEPEPIQWEHLTGNIRFGGTLNKMQWWHLLETPIFVEAVEELLHPND